MREERYLYTKIHIDIQFIRFSCSENTADTVHKTHKTVK